MAAVLAAVWMSSRAAVGAPLVVKGQPVPPKPFVARAQDFAAPAGTTVLHYYGSGGWGIQWRGQYLLLAPYFSNHSIARLLADTTLAPDIEAIRAGMSGTPGATTTLMLIGHGHVDHAGDVGGLFDAGVLRSGRVGLIADRSTTNTLGASWKDFSCVRGLDMADQGKPVVECVPAAFRVTPLHSAHAPHVKMFGADFEMFGGTVKKRRQAAPQYGSDYHLGYPWAFVIDLLDAHGEVAFRIHYMDAAASPPHGILPGTPPVGRDVDLHIACVPGFTYVTEYPDEVLRWGQVRYVLLGHWEDFFRPWNSTLKPVRAILDADRLNQFIDRVELFLGKASRGVAPANLPCAPDRCGPRGPTWALPIPGETFQFVTGAQPPAPRLVDPAE